MTIRWVGGDGVDAPLPVECVEEGYPHVDDNGDVQYDNTHFDTEEEAWESIRRSAAAGVSLSGRLVEERRERLRRAEALAGDDAARFARVEDGHRQWRRRRALRDSGQEES